MIITKPKFCRAIKQNMELKTASKRLLYLRSYFTAYTSEQASVSIQSIGNSYVLMIFMIMYALDNTKAEDLCLSVPGKIKNLSNAADDGCSKPNPN